MRKRLPGSPALLGSLLALGLVPVAGANVSSSGPPGGQAAAFEPATYQSGPLPLRLARTVGWGHVILELAVGETGLVAGVTTLRSTEPFTAAVLQAVEVWRFQPALEDGERVESAVLVAAVFRPAVLYDTPTQGTPPRDEAPPTAAVPFPAGSPVPAYPPTALGDGMAFVEVLVGADGLPEEVSGLAGPSAFLDEAMRVAQQWTFTPARRAGVPVASRAYLLFDFRQPVIAGPPAPTPR